MSVKTGIIILMKTLTAFYKGYKYLPAGLKRYIEIKAIKAVTNKILEMSWTQKKQH